MFNGFYLTYKGQEYIAKSLTGKTLVFTRGQFGNGLIGSGIPNERTSLVSALGDLTISKKTTSENRVTVTTQFSNKVNGSILPAFYLTEAGIYGKVLNADGTTDSAETLIAYACEEQAESDHIKQVLTEFVINWPMVISSEANVEVTIDESLVYPTLAEFKENALISRTGTVEVLRGTNYATSNLSEEKGMVGLSIYGKSLQDGTPTPGSPVEIVSVENPEVKVCGKNLINIVRGGTTVTVTETVENGMVSFSGTATGSGGRTAWGRSDVITLTPGRYTLSMVVPSGTAGNPILTIAETTTVAGSLGSFTIKETTDVYLGFNYENGVTYNAQNVKVQLERGDVATEYEPYNEPKTLSVPHTLRGIPVSSGGNYTDADGQQWLCDEVDLERGVLIQRIGEVNIGELTWNYDEAYTVFTAFVDDLRPSTLTIMCTAYKASHMTSATSPDMTIYGRDISGRGGFGIKNSNYADRVTFTEAMADVIAIYELATPVEIPLTADILNTYYPVTNIFVTDGIDVDFEANIRTRSYANEKRMLDRKKLLWENASPSSQFKAQTLDMDLADYDSVEIEYTNFASEEQLIPADKKDVVKNRLVPLVSWNNLDSSGNNIVVRSRVVTATDGGVEFKTAYGKGTTETSVEQSNTYIIPIKIYGIKGVQ